MFDFFAQRSLIIYSRIRHFDRSHADFLQQKNFNNQPNPEMPATKTKCRILSLGILLMIFLFGGCIGSERDQCQKEKEFKDFESLVNSFSALSSRQECLRLQDAARQLMSNSKGCSDKLEIDAYASPWLSFDCNAW